MSDHTAGCEGGCGCELTGDGWEAVGGVARTFQHTVERCRLIRTLREAGQTAIGIGTSLVRVRPKAFVVHVARSVSVPVPVRVGRGELAGRYEIQCMVDSALAWSHSPDHLGVLAAWVEENIRHALDHPECVTSGSVAGPVLARHPFRGGRS
jgi:hypothetical protein